MLIKKFSGAIVLFLSVIVFVYAVDSYVDIPTKKASELAKKYAIADDNEKKEVSASLHLLAEKYPDNINVIRICSGILSSRGEYNQAISVLSTFNKRNKNTPLMLQECMLKDRTGNYDTLCYGKVISLMKNRGVNNIDYLLALFLTNNNNFNKERDIYIKSTGNKQDLDVFNNERKALLKKLYPD